MAHSEDTLFDFSSAFPFSYIFRIRKSEEIRVRYRPLILSILPTLLRIVRFIIFFRPGWGRSHDLAS